MTKSTELAVNENLPAFLKKDSARGSEEVSSNDVSIPRMSIIQDLSPQRKKNDDKYITGAEEGMSFNTATLELFQKAINIIPIYFRKEWIIWKDINKGGGFFGSFDSEPLAVAGMRDLEGNANDYEIVDTHQHFVLLLKEGSTNDNPILEEVVISCSKSQMKPSRQLNTLAKMAGGDRFSRRYKLEVITDENRAGQKFFNWKFTGQGFVSEAMFIAAEKSYEAIASGQRTVRQDSESSTGQTVDSTAETIEDEF
ncbi:hypothetical protein JKY79_02975 [Candidatus Babeliales bacterium]|nr:hypothetical protein [Candidatus Babeliales bacterium]